MTRMLSLTFCLMAFPASVHAIGTVFYSPTEREAHAGAKHVYTVNGIVWRSDGKSAAWIDGRPVYQGDPMYPKLAIYRDHVLIDGVNIKAGESGDIEHAPHVQEQP